MKPERPADNAVKASNIYLVGMMGSGKSTAGRILAARLKRLFVDLDSEIEKREKLSIAGIFEKKGEPYFRNLEALMLREAAAKSNLVVATGGGIILRAPNIVLMRKTGSVVHLKTSLAILGRRLKGVKDRPLLLTSDRLTRLRALDRERRSLYRKAAHIMVRTDGRRAATLAREIEKGLERLNENC